MIFINIRVKVKFSIVQLQYNAIACYAIVTYKRAWSQEHMLNKSKYSVSLLLYIVYKTVSISLSSQLTYTNNKQTNNLLEVGL